MHHSVAWHTDGYRLLVLTNSPAHHGEILLACGRSKIDESRNAAKHRDVEEADVGDVVHRVHSASHNIDDSRIGIDAKVLGYLVVGALYESAVHSPHGAQSPLGHTRNHGNSLFLGNAHVKMLRASLLALVGSKSGSRWSAGCHGNEGIVLLHLAQHPVAEELLISLAGLYLRHSSVGVSHRSAAILKIERHSPMPSLLVLNGRSIAMSLLRVDMHHSRAVGVLDATEHLNKLFDVIALLQILILKSPSLKPVVLALAVALSQRTQILVYTAVVLGYRHLVVVHHNDDARAKLRSLVESLESLTARQRAVAYHGNDVLLCALYVTGLLQARGKTDGGGSVAHLKIVVLRTLRRRRISRYCIHIVYVAQESRRTSG